MSPKAFVRSAVSAVILTVVACGDHSRITAPAALERGPDATAQVVSCDVSWIDATGGSWSDPLNWSTGVVPNASQHVCITLQGTYTVNVWGSASANTVTIDATNNAGEVTVNVQVAGVSSTLTAANGILNEGLIALSGGSATNSMFATVAVTEGQLVNNGRIMTFPDGVGSQRMIRANLVNNGTVIANTPLQLSKSGAIFENRGNFTASGVNVDIFLTGNIGQTFRQSAGTLTLGSGANFNVTNERFEFVGGTIVGAPVITSGNLTIANGNESAGTFVIRGSSTLAGNIAAAQTVYVQAQGAAATLTSATGFTNAGKIEFVYTHGTVNNQMFSALAVTDGVLTNTGTLGMRPHFAWAQVAADVINLGTMDVQSIVQFTKPGAVIENRGTVNVATGSQLNLVANTNQLFRQGAGTLTLAGSGTMTVNAGTFEAVGGTVSGMPQLNNALLRFAAECSGGGTIGTWGASAKLEGDVPAGWTVHVNGAGFTQLTSAGSFTNRGRIELARSYGGSNQDNAMLTVTSGTMTNEGTLATVPDGLGSMRTINANVINNGTVSVNAYTVLARQNGTFVNNGTMAVGSGTILTGTGLSQTFTTTGSITGGGGRIELKDMTMNASGNAATHLTLNNVALHIGGNALGTMNLTGSYTQIGTTSVNVQLRDGTPGGYDRFNVNGPATMGYWANMGALNISAFEGACIEPNQTFDIMTYTARGYDFLAINGLDLGGGRTLTMNAGATSHRLTSAGPTCVPPPPPPVVTALVTGTQGNNGWYTSDVTVEWKTDFATSHVGCEDQHVTTDTQGTTFTCKATGAGGTTTQSVTIKRDATAPVVSAMLLDESQSGWYGMPVPARYSATDAMSGLAGTSPVVHLFDTEGANQSHSHTFTDAAGNSATGTVSGVNLDFTPPTWTASASPTANAAGWNNTNVTVTFTLSDALSGIDGPTTATFVFDQEGANQIQVRDIQDKAGISRQLVYRVSIDKTAPTVTVTRSPAADATGWNDTDVTATWTASDALSGISGSATATHLFNTDGAGQSATRSFSDQAGNGASATIANINIDKTPAPPPPPPPPPTLSPSCSATPSEIWPANNKMVAVRATIGGTGVTSYRLRSVSNNESGSSDVEGWAIGTADVDGSVLAKRLGGGSGRTYTLTYDVFGANGATGSCAVTVRVPHDQRGR